jgi:hypothetical protein
MGRWEFYTIGRVVHIPWGEGVKIPWVGDQYSMGRGSKYHG